MTETPGHDASQFRRLDAICDRFEAAWQRALADETEPPRIEEFLVSVDTESDNKLLVDLIRLDVAYRQRNGEQPTPADYSERCRARSSVLEQAFGPEDVGTVLHHQPGLLSPCGRC